jgi:MFS family permease
VKTRTDLSAAGPQAPSRANAGLPGNNPVGAWFVAVYALAYASLWLALLTPATVTLALRVRQMASGDSARLISEVLLAGALVALVSNPIFGALSDRTRSRFGRRRPYLLLGALVGLGALWLIAVAPGLRLVLIGWCLAQLSYNAVLAAMVAVVADEIPASRRGTVVGVLGICMPVGQIAGTFLVQHLAFDLRLALLVPGGIGLVGVWALAFLLPARMPPGWLQGDELGAAVAGAAGAAAVASSAGAVVTRAAAGGAGDAKRGEATGGDAKSGGETQRGEAKGGDATGDDAKGGDAKSGEAKGSSYARRPMRRFLWPLAQHRDFAWAWSSRVLFVVGSVSFQAYQPFLLLDGLGFDAAQVPGLIFRSTLVQAVMTVLWSLVAGRLSDRWRRRKPIAMIGSLLQGAGLWIVAMADSYTMLLCGVAIAGIGHGAYEGVDLALVTEILPDRDRHAAKDLGVLNIANALPQVIAPLAAPVILASSHGNYTLLFLVAGAVPMLGATLLVPLKGAR